MATTLRRLGVSAADVDDLTQDVFVAVNAHWPEFDDTRATRPWLFGFCLRASANYRRLARHHREAHVDVTQHADTSERADDALERSRRRDALLAALESIDLDHRAAVVLVDLDHVPPKEAADVLGIPLNTVYSRVRNGREKLRQALSQASASSKEAHHA